MASEVQTRRGVLGMLAIFAGGAAAFALGCSGPETGSEPVALNDPSLPPAPSGPVPPNAIPVRCPW